jgi:hypothetical protein
MKSTKKVPVAKKVAVRKPAKKQPSRIAVNSDELFQTIISFDVQLKPLITLMALNLLVSMSAFTLYLLNTFLFVK